MDISYLLFLQNMREATNGVLNVPMSYITTYGEELLGMMIVAAVYWCIDKNQGIYTMMTWGMGRLINGFLKVTACVYRPWIRDARVIPVDGAKTTATGYSFPSGHTTNATAVYGSIALNKKVSKILRFLLIFVILLIAFSRNYLGVHTPQDVIVGFGCTVIILFFIRWLLVKVDETDNLDIVVLTAGIFLSICVVVYSGVKSYPLDYDAAGKLIVDPAKMAIDTYKGCGFFAAVLISWFVDRRWLKYQPKGTVIQRIVCYLIGIMGYFVVVYVIVPLLPQNIAGYILDRFVRLIYVMLIVPFIISKIMK